MANYIKNIICKIKDRVMPKPVNAIRQNLSMRENMLKIEEEMRKIPGAKCGDSACPLRHIFVDGAYVREITMPKGMLLTSKIHKKEHPYFIMKGEVSIITEEGIIRIKAPYQGITKAGTKRLIYIHEDTTWTTVHVTKSRDLREIEKEIIAKNYNEIGSPTWVSKLLKTEVLQCS